MTKELWQFTPINNFEDLNFNKTLENFYRMGVAGLTRENIQNSLDGRLRDSEKPVIVRINLGEMNRHDIPDIASITERINCLEGRNTYTKETINHMKDKMNEEKVRFISFEDENTLGLTGAKHGQSNLKEHTWGIYAYNTGVHFEDQDSNLEASRGGSHGVGKIASNAASDLHLMYFANCDENNEQHLGGTIQLIEHLYKDQYYRSTGYFSKIEKEGNFSKFMPFENKFGEVFQKNSRGLKIIIPFLRKNFFKEKEVIVAVCDSFFMSILEGKLIVYVNETIIDRNNIVSIIKNEKYYEQNKEEIKHNFTPLYVETFLEKKPITINVDSLNNTYEFQLYFNYDEAIARGRVAIVRTIGMKIEDFKVIGNVMKPFNAVLVGGLKEDEFLKSLENESHTAISATHFKDSNLKRNATRFINNLSKEVAKIIDEKVRENNPVDGDINTEDLLYTLEVDFKENLTETFEKVKVKSGRNLVTGQGKRESNTKRAPETRGKGDRKAKSTATEPRNKRAGNTIGGDELREVGEEEKTTYKITPYRVNRLITEKHELIQIDLTEDNELEHAKNCNVRFTLVDGMGHEYVNEFSMLDNYEEAIDLKNNQNVLIKNEALRNVSIKDGLINLQLTLSSTFNRSLKFIYYVEV